MKRTDKEQIVVRNNSYRNDNSSEIANWVNMPYDVFKMFILENTQLGGKDIIGLCNTNGLMNNKCNSRNGDLFKNLIMRDGYLNHLGSVQVIKEHLNSLTIEDLRKFYSISNTSRLWALGYNGHGQCGFPINRGRVNGGGIIFRNPTSDNDNIIRDPTFQRGFRGVKHIACGESFTMIIDYEGDVYAYGKNIEPDDDNRRILGLGPEYNHMTSVDSPTKIDSLSNIVGISCGFSFAIFLGRDGSVWGCGSNSDGQLGTGSFKSTAGFPIKIPGFGPGKDDIRIVKVSCGDAFTMLLDSRGRLWSFGCNRSGELGRIPFISEDVRSMYENQNTPGIVEGFENIRDVSCGAFHVAFISKENSLYTFGRADNGRLGHGNIVYPIPGQPNSTGTISFTHFPIQIITNGTEVKNPSGVLITHKFKSIVQVACARGSTAFVDSDGIGYIAGGNKNIRSYGMSKHWGRPIKVERFVNPKQILPYGANDLLVITSEDKLVKYSIYGRSDGTIGSVPSDGGGKIENISVNATYVAAGHTHIIFTAK